MKKVKFNKRLLGLSINLSAATGRWRRQIWTNGKRARLGVSAILSNEKRAQARGCRQFRPIRASWPQVAAAAEQWRERGGSQSIHSHVTKIEVLTQKILEMNFRGDIGQALG